MKTAYIGLTMLLLVALSVLIYGLSKFYYSDTETLFIIIGVLSIIGGYGLGQYWWQYIYVDKKYVPRWKKQSEKIN